jgi:hypothetical protein
VSDRLQDLQRQRALVQEQLAWLDREIAALQGPTAPPPTPVPYATPVPPVAPRYTPPSSADAAAAEQAADEILAQYRQESQSLQTTVRRGCFLYFFIAMGLLILGVFGLYLFIRK